MIHEAPKTSASIQIHEKIVELMNILQQVQYMISSVIIAKLYALKDGKKPMPPKKYNVSAPVKPMLEYDYNSNWHKCIILG